MDAKNFFDWLIDPVRNHYADFSGRTTRKAFWMFVLVNFIVSVILTIIDEAVGVQVLSTLYSLLLIIPSVAIGARRLHDTDKSGWWQLIGIIPIVGWIILIIMLARKGDGGPNRFGQVVATDSNVPPAPQSDTQAAPAPSAPQTTEDTKAPAPEGSTGVSTAEEKKE